MELNSKEDYVQQNNEKLKPHGLMLIDRSWYAVLIGLAVLAVTSLVALVLLASQGKFQSNISQEVYPLFNATVASTNEYRPTTNNQYEFNPETRNNFNITIPMEVHCECGNRS